jgi:hypothetical protein
MRTNASTASKLVDRLYNKFEDGRYPGHGLTMVTNRKSLPSSVKAARDSFTASASDLQVYKMPFGTANSFVYVVQATDDGDASWEKNLFFSKNGVKMAEKDT